MKTSLRELSLWTNRSFRSDISLSELSDSDMNLTGASTALGSVGSFER